MAGKVTFGFVDFSGEPASLRINIPVLDGNNVEDYTNPLPGSLLGNFKLAVDALTLLNETQITVVAAVIPSPGVLPTDENAQREQKLLVRYLDVVTNKKGSFTIPGIDRTLVAQPGTDVVDMNNVYSLALIAAFEDLARSEVGNAVQVYGLSLVGRNN